MIKVCFAGVTGWTAPPIVKAIDESTDLALVAGVARSAAGRTLSTVIGSTSDGVVYANVSEALRATEIDVLVDFTSVEVAKANVLSAVDAGVRAVVGTSGLTSDDWDEIGERAAAARVGVFAGGNFSVMAAILRRASVMAAEHLDQWEILDYASDTKADVPSGTARDLAETLGAVKSPTPAVPIESLHGPVEARGAGVGGTRVHSLRLPGYVVSTEIVFAGPGERLVLRHDPGLTPDPYVPGTLLAIRSVGGLSGLVRGLDSLLFAPA